MRKDSSQIENGVADDTPLADATIPRRVFRAGLADPLHGADGALEAQEFARLDLAGPGAGEIAGRARPFGFSSLGGLIRARELERDIPHALAIRVDKSRLNVQLPSVDLG